MAELALMAAGSLGATGGALSTIGTLAQVGLTAASAFSSLQAGGAEAAAQEVAARQAGLNARVEGLRGRQDALDIQRQLSRDLASQNALFAARGGLLGEGSAGAARDIAKERASQNIDTALFNANIAQGNAEQRAINARAEGRAAKRAGVFGAVTSLADFKPIPTVPGA